MASLDFDSLPDVAPSEKSKGPDFESLPDIDFESLPDATEEAIPVTPRMKALAAKPPAAPKKSEAFSPTGEPTDPFAGEGLFSKVGRMGQQVVQGVSEVAAGVPEGMALSARATAYDTRRKFQANIDSLTKKRSELEKSNDPDKDQQIDLLDSQIDFAKRGLTRLNEDLSKPLEEAGGFTAAKAIRDTVESTVGAPDSRDQSLTGKLAGGFGSMLAFIGTTVAAARTGGAGVATAAGALVGSTSTASGFYKEARQLGADEETAVRASQWGALIGSAEVVPIMTGLKYLPPALRVKVTNAFLKKALEIGESGTEEAVQEYLSQVGDNLTMIGEKIDPNRSVTEGAAESALLGAILGTGTGALGTLSGEPKVQPATEKGPDADQAEALKTDRETPSAPPPPEAGPAATTATATVTPADPDKGVNVGDTAPDVTAAVTAASNPTTPSAPQKPAADATPAAKGEYIKQMAAFREMERKQREAEQAQANPDTGAPPVPPDTAQAPEGPQVGGAPAAPTNPPNALQEAQQMIADQGVTMTPETQQALAADYAQIDQTAPDFQEQMTALVQKYVEAGKQAPSPAAEAVQGLDEAGAPAAPSEEQPASEAPSPAAEAAAALPPVEQPDVTSEVTPPAEEPPAEPPKERKYRVVRQQDVLLDAGIPEEEFEAMPRKKREQLARDIRAKAERMSDEPLNWMDPADRAEVISKAWTELQRLRAAKPAAPARPPKAAAAVAVSKAKEATAAVDAEAERKARLAAAGEALIKQYEAEANAPKQEPKAQPKAEPKMSNAAVEEVAPGEERAFPGEKQSKVEAETLAPTGGRVLRDVSEAGIKRAAEAKVARDERDQQISAANAAADARAAAEQEGIASGAAEEPEVIDRSSKEGKAEAARREKNNATADEIVGEHNTTDAESSYRLSNAKGQVSRAAILARARTMMDKARERMASDKKGKILPERLRMSADPKLAPNASQMLLREASVLLSKKRPTRQDFDDFRASEALLRAGMVKDYLASRGVEGDIAKAAKATQTSKDGTVTDATEALATDAANPEENLSAREEGTDEEIERASEAVADKTLGRERPKVTSESNPGYTVGVAKKPIIAETKKRPKIDKAKIAQNAKTIPKKIAEKEAADPKNNSKPSDPNVVMTATPAGWGVTGDADAKPGVIKTFDEIYVIKNNFGTHNTAMIAALRRLLKMIVGLDPWVASRATDYDSFSSMLSRLTDEQMASTMQSDRLWDEARGARDPEITKLIIERMNSIIGSVQVYVITDASMDGYNPNAGAYYSPQGDHIVIRESAFKDPEKFLHDLIHEGAHAALWAAVRKNPVARRQLAHMAAVYNETLEINSSEKPYSATNLDEFMSELLSNPNTKNVLSDIQMDDIEFEMIGVPAPKGKMANAWSYIKALVAKAFGFGNENDMSIYARAMDVIDQLLTEAPAARKEQTNLLGEKALIKWQEKQEAEYKAFRDSLPQFDFDSDQVSAKRERYEDLGRNTKNRYPPNLNSENSGKARRQSNWRKMIAGGVDQKTAKEINDWLKSEEGKAVDPATVDLLIQDAIDAFGRKKDTSESNDGGGIIPPYNEPPSPGMGPAEPIEPQPESFRGKDKRWYRKLNRLALKNMTLDFIRQKYNDKLKDAKGSIVKAIVEAVQRRDNIAAEFAEPINKITAEFTDLMRSSRDEAVELAELASEATRLDIKLGSPMTNRGNGAKFLQGKAREAALNERFKKLSPRAQDIYRRMTAAYRDAHNANVEALVYNILARMETKLSNSQVMDLMKRVTEGKLDASDEALINDPILFNGLKNAQGLKTIKGDYFPQMRFGDWVVTTKEKLVDPGWTSVTMKVTRNKVGPNGKVTPSVTTKQIPVKTQVDGNAVRVIVDPTIRGAMTAAKRQLRDYASKHELTLLGISTMYRDKATGKLVSKGDQLIDREYDTVYEARFQTDGVQFFDDEKAAYKFRDEVPSDVVSEVKTRKQLDESALPSGSVLGTIVNRINKDDRLSAGEKKLFDNVVKNAIIASMDGNSARSRYQARRNVKGASKDLARAAVTYGQAAGNFHATLQTAPDLRDAMERLEAFASVTGNKAGGGEISDVAQVLRDRMATIEGTGEPVRLVRTLATLAYMDKLGSLSHSIINGLQPAGTTMPVLAGRYGAGKAALVIGNAYRKIGAGGVAASGLANTGRAIKGSLRTNIDTTDVIGSVRENLRKEYGTQYDALIDRMLELGAVAPDAGQEVAGMVEADANGVTSKVIGRMDRTLRQMPNAVEAINRLVTAVATYDLAIKGKSKQEAIQEAIDTVFNTQGDYRKKNSPRWMQHPALSWAMQFQKYTQMMFQLTVDMGARAINGATPAERWVARKQLTYYYLTQAALAGVWGLPGLQIIKLGALALTALGFEPWDDEEDELRKKIEKNTNPTVASLINNGVLNTLTGFDFSGRLNQSDAGIGYLPTNITKDALQKYFGGLILGNPGGTALDVVGSAEAFAKGDIETGLEKSLLLKQVSDIIGAYKGVRDNKLSPYEAAGKVIGFRSQETADESRQKGVDTRASERRKKTEKDLRAQMMQALDRRDKKAEMQAIRDIMAYNRELRKRDPKARALNPGSIRRYWIEDQRKAKNGS